MKTKIYLVLAVQLVNLLGFISIPTALADDCGSPSGSSGPGCDRCSQPNPPCECFGPCKPEGDKEGQMPPPPPPPLPPRTPQRTTTPPPPPPLPPPPPPPPVPIPTGDTLYIPETNGPRCKTVTLPIEPVTPQVSELCSNSTSVHHISTIGFTYNAICIQDAQDAVTGISNLVYNGTLGQSVACSYPISVISTAFGLLSNPTITGSDTLRLQLIGTGGNNTLTGTGTGTGTNTTTTTTTTTTTGTNTTGTTTNTNNNEETYTLSGTVIGGDTKAGIVGIAVSLLSEGNPIAGTTTDENGNFAIKNIKEAGSYQVKAVDVRAVEPESKYFFGVIDTSIQQKNETVKFEGIANITTNKGLIDAVNKLSLGGNGNTGDGSSITDWLNGLFGNNKLTGNNTGDNTTGINGTGGLSGSNGTVNTGLTSNSLLSLLNNGFNLGNGDYSPVTLSLISKLGNIGAICGNGLPEIGETCDDGINNGKNGYCSSDCLYTGEVRTQDSSLTSNSTDNNSNNGNLGVTGNKVNTFIDSILSKLNGNKDDIKKQLGQVNDEINEIDTELTVKNTERARIEQDLSQARAQLTEIRDQILHDSAERDALLNSIRLREQAIKTLRQELAQLNPNSAEAKKIQAQILELEKLNALDRERINLLDAKIAAAKIKENELLQRISQLEKALSNINNEIRQLMERRAKAVLRRTELMNKLNGNILSNAFSSGYSILSQSINRVGDTLNTAEDWSRMTIIANTSPETRKVMKQVAAVTTEVVKYSVVGVICLLGASAIGLNIMVFRTQWTAYTILDGDTFDTIGSKFNMTERALRRRNGIDKKKSLRPGMKIKVRNRTFIEKDYLDQLKSVLTDSLKTKDHNRVSDKILKMFVGK